MTPVERRNPETIVAPSIYGSARRRRVKLSYKSTDRLGLLPSYHREPCFDSWQAITAFPERSSAPREPPAAQAVGQGLLPQGRRCCRFEFSSCRSRAVGLAA